MKKWLIRPASALFPASMALGWVFMPEFVSKIMLAYLAVALLSGCAAQAFRNAATREPARRRVDRRFFGGLSMILLSTLLVSLVCLFTGQWGQMYLAILAGFALNIEQMFEERSYALGRAIDAPLMAPVSALLTAGGALTGKEMLFSILILAGALFALLFSLLRTHPQCVDLLPRNLGFFPKAALQSLLYPLVCAAFFLYNGNGSQLPLALVGGMLWRLGRTPCRRTADEARQFNLIAVTFCAALLAWKLGEADSMIVILIALLCTFAVFLTPTRRLCCGTLLLIGAAACAWLNVPAYVAYVLCVISVAINIKPALLTKKR